jgi:protein transport protein SEC24
VALLFFFSFSILSEPFEQSHLGGKLVVFCANLPSIGDGKLKLRENPRLLGTDKEYLLLNPEEKWYQVSCRVNQ